MNQNLIAGEKSLDDTRANVTACEHEFIVGRFVTQLKSLKFNIVINRPTV